MEFAEVRRALDAANRVAGEAFAHIAVSQRADEAQEYCQKYLMPQARGKIIWHAILDDAIRMRKQIENHN